ncbi:ARRD3 protein, partial [Atractosteus spatula]|nr:ARRD3 protein [Atractosteus spatula]
MDKYKKPRYDLRKAIKIAKYNYRVKLEPYYHGCNTRNMWSGIHTITDYKAEPSYIAQQSASLPGELNSFYARFEVSNADRVRRIPEIQCEHPLSISRAYMCKVFKKTNPRKAPGPDAIPGRVLKACADQLADVFSDIFNLSLAQSIVPSCFKKTTIVPVPKKPRVGCLNDYRPVALSQQLGSKEKTLGCLCCTSGPITLSARIERKGYTPGEFIRVFTEVENGSSREVRPKVALQQLQTFHAQGKTKRVPKRIASLEGPPVGGRMRDAWSEGVLHIPPDTPISLLNCALMSVEYSVVVRVAISSSLSSVLARKQPFSSPSRSHA